MAGEAASGSDPPPWGVPGSPEPPRLPILPSRVLPCSLDAMNGPWPASQSAVGTVDRAPAVPAGEAVCSGTLAPGRDLGLRSDVCPWSDTGPWSEGHDSESQAPAGPAPLRPRCQLCQPPRDPSRCITSYTEAKGKTGLRSFLRKSLLLSNLRPCPTSSQHSAFVFLRTEHAGRWVEEAGRSCASPRRARCLRVAPFPRPPSPPGRNPSFRGGGAGGGAPSRPAAVPGQASLTLTPEPHRPRQPARERARVCP